MASPIGRLIAQVLVVGTSVVSKAFVQAYQNAVASAGRSGGAKAAAQNLSEALSRKIKIPEARSVLNMSENFTKEELEANFKKLFAANDVNNGGSFYLQSKVYRAHEALSEVLKQKGAEAAAEASKTAAKGPRI